MAILIDVSRHPISPIFKVFLDFVTLEDETDMLNRNVSKEFHHKPRNIPE